MVPQKVIRVHWTDKNGWVDIVGLNAHHFQAPPAWKHDFQADDISNQEKLVIGYRQFFQFQNHRVQPVNILKTTGKRVFDKPEKQVVIVNYRCEWTHWICAVNITISNITLVNITPTTKYNKKLKKFWEM